MKIQLTLINILIIPILAISQLFAPSEYYFKIGDTLTVLSGSGIVLRDSASITSDKILGIPFGINMIVKDVLLKRVEFQNRRGFWIKTEFNQKTGFAFSGFLTKLKIPKLNLPQYDCDNLSWIEDIGRLNADSLIYEGAKEYNGMDPLDGKDNKRSDSQYFKDETIITHYTGYEYMIGIVESVEFNMNDVLNIMEYYIDKLKSKCNESFYMGGEYKNLKIITKKDENNSVFKIECTEMLFTAEKVAHKVIISFPISGCISFN